MTDLRQYELMLIFAPNRSSNEQEKSLKIIKKQIESFGGKITDEDIWGLREFSYRIKKFDEGYYSVIHFDSTPAKIKELNEFLSLERYVLRHLVSMLDDNYKKINYKIILEEEKKAQEELEAKKNSSEVNKQQRFIKKDDKKTADESKKQSKDLSEKKVVKKEESKTTETPQPKASGVDENFDSKLENIIKGDDLEI